jgi:hypothetical protein
LFSTKKKYFNKLGKNLGKKISSFFLEFHERSDTLRFVNHAGNDALFPVKIQFTSVKIKCTSVEIKCTSVKIKCTSVKIQFTSVNIKFTIV